MKKWNSFDLGSKRSRMISIGLLVSGCILCGIGFSLVDFDIYQLDPKPKAVMTSKEQTFSLQDIQTIDIDVNRAIIEVEQIEGSQFQLQYSEKEEEPLTLETTNKTLSLRNQKKASITMFGWMNFSDHDQLKIKLQIPKEYVGDVQLTTSYGTVNMRDVMGIAKLSIANRHGEINVDNIDSSSVNLANSYGETKVTAIRSSSSFYSENEHAPTYIDEVEALEVRVINSYGLTNVSNVKSANDFSIENEHNTIETQTIEANTIALSNSYGDIVSDQLVSQSDLSIENEHANIELTKAQSKRSKIEASYSDIVLKDWLSEEMVSSVEHGNLTASILGQEEEFHIKSYVEHGESNLASEANKKLDKKLEFTISYGDLYVTFQDQ